MIDAKTFSKEHFDELKNKKSINPPILERALFALGLVEALRKVDMNFIFKGGSSLMILLDKPMRLSTDVDILVEPGYDIDSYIEKASNIFPFLRKEESVRKTNKDIEKRHFRFYFKSISNPEEELSILLDVVFEHNPYPNLLEKEIKNELLVNSGESITVNVPNINCIIGDKLTAFAPHTIGVMFFNDKFSNDKRLEVIKQFYDIATLFDHVSNFDEVKNSYFSVAKNELMFRNLSIDVNECLLDTYNAALTILLRGENNEQDYPNYLEGMRRLRGHVYGEIFSSEIARLHAPKVMLLAACLYKDINIKDAKYNDDLSMLDRAVVKSIKAFSKAEKTRRAFELAITAMHLMN